MGKSPHPKRRHPIIWLRNRQRRNRPKLPQRLSEITEANIATSATPTGSAELGGNWKLEVQTGDIKATIPFNAKALNTYSDILGLAPKETSLLALGRCSVSIGDINGDGLPDLAGRNTVKLTPVLHPAQHHRHGKSHPPPPSPLK